ncbi:hypothetical protein B0F90DRAFT_1919688 [Multifurca ochricompacta]|uniref:Uncharacterized protein n=1 Tax=Multifurca ochricompacta TaxID=376703 RepID=A0AAD4QHG6_9AGAM|nr:hypothetical protein B0F90DRAFT_1919688 [Multifurca ochricompacta]
MLRESRTAAASKSSGLEKRRCTLRYAVVPFKEPRGDNKWRVDDSALGDFVVAIENARRVALLKLGNKVGKSIDEISGEDFVRMVRKELAKEVINVARNSTGTGWRGGSRTDGMGLGVVCGLNKYARKGLPGGGLPNVGGASGAKPLEPDRLDTKLGAANEGETAKTRRTQAATEERIVEVRR